MQGTKLSFADLKASFNTPKKSPEPNKELDEEPQRSASSEEHYQKLMEKVQADSQKEEIESYSDKISKNSMDSTFEVIIAIGLVSSSNELPLCSFIDRQADQAFFQRSLRLLNTLWISSSLCVDLLNLETLHQLNDNPHNKRSYQVC